jgi:hypothetical protein
MVEYAYKLRFIDRDAYFCLNAFMVRFQRNRPAHFVENISGNRKTQTSSGSALGNLVVEPREPTESVL